MSFSPEVQVLIINAEVLLVSYFGIHWRNQTRDFNTLAAHDMIISVVTLITIGGLFWGTDTAFNLLGYETNWFVFGLVTLIALEVPLMVIYAKLIGVPLRDLLSHPKRDDDET